MYVFTRRWMAMLRETWGAYVACRLPPGSFEPLGGRDRVHGSKRWEAFSGVHRSLECTEHSIKWKTENLRNRISHLSAWNSTEIKVFRMIGIVGTLQNLRKMNCPWLTFITGRQPDGQMTECLEVEAVLPGTKRKKTSFRTRTLHKSILRSNKEASQSLLSIRSRGSRNLTSPSGGVRAGTPAGALHVCSAP